MRARIWLNVVLLALALGLGWLVYQQSRDGPTGISGLRGEDVRTIALERGGQVVVRLARGEGGWRITEPRSLPASEFHVDMLLRFLEQPADYRIPRAEAQLAALGLAQPKTVIRFNDQAFAFGDLDPLSGRRYVLHGDEVALLAEGVSALASSPWWNFIDRRLLPAGARVEAVELDGRELTAAKHPLLATRWQDAHAAMVRPMHTDDGGHELIVRLRDGQRLRWLWVDDDQPRLLRPDLGLAYHINRESLAVLTGRRQP